MVRRARALSGPHRQLGPITLALLSVLATLAAVLLSPLGLRWLGHRSGYDWSVLGNVGQAYGAASAILAALALIGVVGSLLLQAREAKANREQTLRSLHADLLMTAIEKPEFLPCWGPVGDTTDPEWVRKHIYTNLIVSHWQLMWELGALTEAHLEVLLEQFFAGAVGRRFWSEARGPRLKAETSRRARRFTRTVDRIYVDALASGPPRDILDGGNTEDEGDETVQPAMSWPGAQLFIGIALGAAAVAAGWRFFSHRKPN
jgi:hypothetical protein